MSSSRHVLILEESRRLKGSSRTTLQVRVLVVTLGSGVKNLKTFWDYACCRQYDYNAHESVKLVIANLNIINLRFSVTSVDDDLLLHVSVSYYISLNISSRLKSLEIGV